MEMLFCEKCNKFIDLKYGNKHKLHSKVQNEDIKKIKKDTCKRVDNIVENVGDKIKDFKNFTLKTKIVNKKIIFKDDYTYNEDLTMEENLDKLNNLIEVRNDSEKEIIINVIYNEEYDELYTEYIENGQKRNNPADKIEDLIKLIDINNYIETNNFENDISYYHSSFLSFIYDVINKPYIEILIKSGFYISTLINHIAIKNPKGKTPYSIFGLTKAKLNFIKECINDKENTLSKYYFDTPKEIIGFLSLNDLELNKSKEILSNLKKYRDNTIITIQEARRYFDVNTNKLGISEINDVIKISNDFNLSITKLFKYLTLDLVEKEGLFDVHNNIYYYKKMIDNILEYSDTKTIDFFPKNFLTIKRKIEFRKMMVKQEQQNEEFKKAVSKLEKYKFENDKYFITYPHSIQELITEGERLIDCLGTYVREIIDEESIIFFMRKKEEPEKAYIAFELENDLELVQARGYRNRNANEKEVEFVKSFINYMKNYKEEDKQIEEIKQVG